MTNRKKALSYPSLVYLSCLSFKVGIVSLDPMHVINQMSLGSNPENFLGGRSGKGLK